MGRKKKECSLIKFEEQTIGTPKICHILLPHKSIKPTTEFVTSESMVTSISAQPNYIEFGF